MHVAAPEQVQPNSGNSPHLQCWQRPTSLRCSPESCQCAITLCMPLTFPVTYKKDPARTDLNSTHCMRPKKHHANQYASPHIFSYAAYVDAGPGAPFACCMPGPAADCCCSFCASSGGGSVAAASRRCGMQGAHTSPSSGLIRRFSRSAASRRPTPEATTAMMKERQS